MVAVGEAVGSPIVMLSLIYYCVALLSCVAGNQVRKCVACACGACGVCASGCECVWRVCGVCVARVACARVGVSA